jgi:hypothetical protein
MRGRRARALARDSNSTWTNATRSVSPARGGGTQSQPGHEVQLPLLALRRRQEQLLVQPVDGGELEARRPGGEEAEEEGLEAFLEQHLQALVVIRSGGLRHDRLPVDGRSGKPERAKSPEMSEVRLLPYPTRHCGSRRCFPFS